MELVKEILEKGIKLKAKVVYVSRKALYCMLDGERFVFYPINDVNVKIKSGDELEIRPIDVKKRVIRGYITNVFHNKPLSPVELKDGFFNAVWGFVRYEKGTPYLEGDKRRFFINVKIPEGIVVIENVRVVGDNIYLTKYSRVHRYVKGRSN